MLGQLRPLRPKCKFQATHAREQGNHRKWSALSALTGLAILNLSRQSVIVFDWPSGRATGNTPPVTSQKRGPQGQSIPEEDLVPQYCLGEIVLECTRRALFFLLKGPARHPLCKGRADVLLLPEPSGLHLTIVFCAPIDLSGHVLSCELYMFLEAHV